MYFSCRRRPTRMWQDAWKQYALDYIAEFLARFLGIGIGWCAMFDCAQTALMPRLLG
jgi:hypothetical protein